MKYKIRYSNLFKKSYKRCIKRGFREEDFRETLLLLAENGSLPQKYRPHKLSGKYNGLWECHINSDWLLVWEQSDEELVLVLIDTGTHSDLF